jgi:hypothetical protein
MTKTREHRDTPEAAEGAKEEVAAVVTVKECPERARNDPRRKLY